MTRKRAGSGSERPPQLSNTPRAHFSSIRDIHTHAKEIRAVLKRFALTVTRQADAADDLVQETFMRALMHQEKFQEGTSLLSWMMRILQNLHLDKMRASKVQHWVQEPFDVSDIKGKVPSTPPTQESAVALGELQNILEQLTPSQQELITLLVQGMTYKEIADTLKIPLGTAMSRLARLRAHLRDATGHDPENE